MASKCLKAVGVTIGFTQDFVGKVVLNKKVRKQAVKACVVIAKQAIKNDKKVDKTAGVVSGFVIPIGSLVLSTCVSNHSGAAAITSSLAKFGGPWGMVGGVGFHILMSLLLSNKIESSGIAGKASNNVFLKVLDKLKK